jgi:hypothetical protein
MTEHEFIEILPDQTTPGQANHRIRLRKPNYARVEAMRPGSSELADVLVGDGDDLKENQVTFPNLLDSSLPARQVMARHETLSSLSAVPFTYVIDRDGKINEAWYGHEPARTEKAFKKLEF